MPGLIEVTIHESCFPAAQSAALRRALRTRSIPGKWHYLSTVQVQAWLAVHRRHSPSRADAVCAAAYEDAFTATARQLANTTEVTVVGLGCGGGQKDTRLLMRLTEEGGFPLYVPQDVSVPMVITAAQTACQARPAMEVEPLVADLLEMRDLPRQIDGLAGVASRVITCFGLLPNFAPNELLARLTALVRPEDVLLLNANLAPGPDYAAGCETVLPLYDNPETRAWLGWFLKDLGLDPTAGTMEFGVVSAPAAGVPMLRRINVVWTPAKLERLPLAESDETVLLAPDQPLELFFSYRHTPGMVRSLLAAHQLAVVDEWVTAGGEEGIFLCRSMPASQTAA